MSKTTFPHELARSRWRKPLLLGLTGLLLGGCAAPAYRVQTVPTSQPPPPVTELYFYPTRHQSPAQQERDRYECYRWAVKQSGFDPGQGDLAPHQRVEVTPVEPPGTDIAVGAVSGAMIGSILSPRHDSGQGMVFGAITGAILGAASDANKQQQAQQLQQHYDARDAQQYARVDKQARDYRRAMTACLEGRGYTVR